MNSVENALKERIKELTCLYEVSSIIEDASSETIAQALKAIAMSLQKAFLYPRHTDIRIETKELALSTGLLTKHGPMIKSKIKVFNEIQGTIVAVCTATSFKKTDFLNDEHLLMDNVALKIGNFLERVEIENREKRLKRQMERADRLGILGEITAGIAHELNTPLANILGFAELLKSDFSGNKTVVSDIDKIIDNAIFSREVIKKLLFFACEMPQEMKTVNLVPNIKNAINLLDATFRKEKVKYTVKIEQEALWLRADPIQLTQIIFNLLMNAIYFTPNFGLIIIEAKETKKHVVLKVSDQGTGIPPDELDKIFQPFFTTKGIGNGSGLGLSVVHGIVASHGGTIIATNNLDKGVTFTIRLPKT